MMSAHSDLRGAPIRGTPVRAAWPSHPTDPVFVALYGEAPGRHGADKSGVPFWGDRAARVCYAALAEAGAASWHGGVDTLKLLGLELIARNLRPTLHGVMLSNAYDRCPAGSPTRIRPPTPLELRSKANGARLRKELSTARSRGCRLVVAMGRIAGQKFFQMRPRRSHSSPDGRVAYDTRHSAASVRTRITASRARSRPRVQNGRFAGDMGAGDGRVDSQGLISELTDLAPRAECQASLRGAAHSPDPTRDDDHAHKPGANRATRSVEYHRLCSSSRSACWRLYRHHGACHRRRLVLGARVR